jgi:uncharacterized membrane protein
LKKDEELISGTMTSALAAYSYVYVLVIFSFLLILIFVKSMVFMRFGTSCSSAFRQGHHFYTFVQHGKSSHGTTFSLPVTPLTQPRNSLKVPASLTTGTVVEGKRNPSMPLLQRTQPMVKSRRLSRLHKRGASQPNSRHLIYRSSYIPGFRIL